MAAWNRDAFDPNMTVWGIFCIDDSLWARSQRIRQYTNSHDETWGGVTIEIDSNAVDSIVADLDVAPPTPTPTPYAAAERAAGGARAWSPAMTEACAAPAGTCWSTRAATRPISPPTRTATARFRRCRLSPGRPAGSRRFPSDGYYRVEAYIPGHDALQWTCPDAELAGDTATAYYTVQHAEGTTVKNANQAAG